MKLKTNPPKWTYDLYPQDFAIRKYIFDTWRKVCKSFWFEEYLWPLVEDSNIWKAKSWEDVWWSELTLITDRNWNISDLALRPEMTPTVTRMVSKKYDKSIKPLKYFSIANFYRNERPQRWRNREFWQVNFDIFWSKSIYVDIEVIQLSIEIMLAFNPPKWSFVLLINNRKIINYFLNNILSINDTKEVLRVMDKWKKLDLNDFQSRLTQLNLTINQINDIIKYLNTDSIKDLIFNFPAFEDFEWYIETINIINNLIDLWYWDYIQFDGSLIRWFDYYDGVVFEMFDKSPQNNRSMFGWWRYNGLSSIFWVDTIPSVWAAPWDETFRLFLESWGLIDQIINIIKEEVYYIPLLDEKYYKDIQSIASYFRKQWNLVELGTDVKKISKALEYANKKWISFVVIVWEDEIKKWWYKIKELNTGKEYFIAIK